MMAMAEYETNNLKLAAYLLFQGADLVKTEAREDAYYTSRFTAFLTFEHPHIKSLVRGWGQESFNKNYRWLKALSERMVDEAKLKADLVMITSKEEKNADD